MSGHGHAHGKKRVDIRLPDHDHGHDHDHDHDAELKHELRGDLARGAGAGKILFLDAFSGIAGDMLAAALLDLGVPIEPVLSGINSLAVEGWTVSVPGAVRHGIAAARFVVEVEGDQPLRTYADVQRLFGRAEWSDGARVLALDALRRLGEAESEVHRTPLEEVHFHEVGAVDSIVDLAAGALALDWVGARVIASPLPMGRGFTQAQHGTLPLPAPATVACLRGVPTYDAGVEGELVTPTGACLVAAAASEFARWPRMRPDRIGWGAGTRDRADRPNVLRVVLGTPEATATAGVETEATHVVLEANLDDITAEIAGWVIERALAGGALDAWAAPIVMKKGRPALQVSALARRADADAVARVLLTESTTLGLRVVPVSRVERPRRMIHVDTEHGTIAVKVADGDGLPANVAPEHDACRRIAEAKGVPLKTVYAAAIAAAETLLRGRT